jgi:hypothetical protein
LVNQKDRVSKDFQDLLPKSWSDMEAEDASKGAVRYNGESRGMHLILLVAKSPDEMTNQINKIKW